ncbi:MAG TPA: DUF1552 domain-containing protein [Vicinamibacterales bacterium]|nr:DUF1552 domain-containing protein [Vicinamibacterales bacterium]
MMISKMALPRRTFLRGLGVMLGLPFLDAMVPALSALSKTAGAPIPRMLWTYVPNGILLEDWYPNGEQAIAGEGAGFKLSESLAPYAEFKDQLVAVQGLASPAAESRGNSRAPHTKAHTAYLSGARAKYTEGADIELGETVDQYLADAIGKDTPLRSLEIALEANYMTGNCDNGYACVYQSAMAWQTATMPLPGETNPRVVFERLFGDGSTGSARLTRLQENRSILDAMTADMKMLERKLGPSDRTKVDEYLHTIRDVESRIQRAEARSSESPLPIGRPASIPEDFEEHAKLMWDLVFLAWQADITRVATYQVSREQSDHAYPQVGVKDGHHSVSHHGHNPERMKMHTRINTYHNQLVAYFAGKLKKTQDGDGSLLDHSLIVHGSGMGDADAHDPHNLAITMVGGLCGKLKGNRSLVYPVGDCIPFMNLNLALLNMAGVNVQTIGDSTGFLGGV